eukprot:2637939-Rhodomonas_salina.1
MCIRDSPRETAAAMTWGAGSGTADPPGQYWRIRAVGTRESTRWVSTGESAWSVLENPRGRSVLENPRGRY